MYYHKKAAVSLGVIPGVECPRVLACYPVVDSFVGYPKPQFKGILSFRIHVCFPTFLNMESSLKVLKDASLKFVSTFCQSECKQIG